MFDANEFLQSLIGADAPAARAPDPLSATEPEADSLDWRVELTPAEAALFPQAEPPAEFLKTMLAVRTLFGGELVEVRYPALGDFYQAATGRLVPDALPPDWREWYEERAAIREYDGCQTREHAEAAALSETILAMKAAGEWPVPKS